MTSEELYCDHCGAVVDYEICQVTRCRKCGERIVKPLEVSPGVERFEWSELPPIVVVDPLMKR